MGTSGGGSQGGGQDGENHADDVPAGVALVQDQLPPIPNAQGVAEEHDAEDGAEPNAGGEAFLAARLVGSVERLAVLLQG